MQAKNVNYWLTKGNDPYKMKKFSEAIEYYDKAIELDPNNIGAWINKGEAYYDLGGHERALLCFDKALMINSDDP
jgi:tetratricopeptide (TPR) repeat protein